MGMDDTTIGTNHSHIPFDRSGWQPNTTSRSFHPPPFGHAMLLEGAACGVSVIYRRR